MLSTDLSPLKQARDTDRELPQQVLAIALQTQQEIKLGAIQAEDMYQLSKLCLEFAEWRRCPTRRVVQTLFLSCMYMNNDNDSELVNSSRLPVEVDSSHARVLNGFIWTLYKMNSEKRTVIPGRSDILCPGSRMA